MPPSVETAGNRSSDYTTLDSHATLPYKRNFKQVILIIGPVKEKHVP